ncbi:Syndecan-2-B [Acropora cervicornis]|uniref:Syndecan-2-B n=1 Tax=Acropora cervicornis TaxID=6130 RepID=A0AAD9USN1_ACRCE|nr:Syndecan-2-B [Acropora cervicornis]
MRPKLILFVCVAVSNVLFGLHGAMANFDGYIDIDGDAESSNSGETKEYYGKGGDDEDGSGVMSEESGSGSGEPSTSTDDPSTVDVSVESVATTESATSAQGETTTERSEAGETTKGTSGVDQNVSEDEDGNVFAGGVGGDTMALQNKDKDLDNTAGEKEVMKVLTAEVIAAVVVGAVCAVILIAFLVYRLRKRDEGSYSLSDVGYKDTYKLHADTGKEAFV